MRKYNSSHYYNGKNKGRGGRATAKIRKGLKPDHALELILKLEKERMI